MGRSYNGWSADERNQIGDTQNALLQRYPHYRQSVCQACGIARGVVQHLEDYSRPLEGIIGLCTRCHVAVHERFRYPRVWKRYTAMIRDGYIFPVASSNWLAVLKEQYPREGDGTVWRKARPGPERGPTILDEIGTGQWLGLGPGAPGGGTAGPATSGVQGDLFGEST